MATVRCNQAELAQFTSGERLGRWQASAVVASARPLVIAESAASRGLERATAEKPLRREEAEEGVTEAEKSSLLT